MSSNKRGYLAYLAVVFINAFVDLGHKIVIQNAIFKSYDGQHQIILTAIVNGLILLPFILLFSPAGYLADRFAKHRIIRYSAAVAVVAVALICFCYYQGWFWAAFALTFLLAVQSAVYSPAKYGYIKELVGAKQLAAANGTVQAITIAGILLGTLVFSMLFEALLPEGGTTGPGDTMRYIAPIGWVLIALALLEWFASGLLPARRKGADIGPFSVARYARLGYLRDNLNVLGERSAIWLSIIGLATFWAISQVMLAAFPAFAKEVLGETNTVVIQGILACSGIGIVLGSLVAGRNSKNYIETGFVPIGALGITLGLALLPTLDSFTGMALSFLFVGFMGGMFIVPLNALIQFQAPKDKLGTVLAGNNWVQNVAMMAGLALTVVFASAGTGSVGLFYLLTAVALIGTGYTVRKLPHSLARIVATMILKRRYRIEVVGFDNLPQSGATLLLGNHISWIDWALVQIACPRPIRFVMLKRIYDTWYLKPLFKAFGVIPIASGQSEASLTRINELLKAGECVCLFPEGAISRNGHLGKFHTGYERTLDGVEEGVIVPFYLHGLWGSSLSRAEEGLREARAPDARRDLIVAFGDALSLTTGAKALKQAVIELAASAWRGYSQSLDSVTETWLHAARRHPTRTAIAAVGEESCDSEQLVLRAGAVARGLPISQATRLGLLLPTGVDGATGVLGALWYGAAVVPLDPAAEPAHWRERLDEAGADAVLTSRALLESAELDAGALAAALPACELYFIEDLLLRDASWRRWLQRLQFRLLPVSWCYRLGGRRVDPDAAAAVLFDAQGAGVVLSQRNIVANSRQTADVLNMRSDDVLVCAQPLDRPAGLITALLMPLLEGVPVLCHSEPGDALGLARAIGRYSGTVLPATTAQLTALADETQVHPLMLESLRLVLHSEGHAPTALHEAFTLRFGQVVRDGFGNAATTALATLNIPDAIDPKDWKVQQGTLPGSVGMPLPGTRIRVLDAEGEALPLGESGNIWLGGVQMASTVLEGLETTRLLQDEQGLYWFSTGHRGYLNEEGFVFFA